MVETVDPDAKLMCLVRDNDDRQAFRQLFERYMPRVVRYVTHFLGSPARAEDIAQEVFLNIYRTRHRYRPQTDFHSYIYRVATNACRSELRRPEYRQQFQTWPSAAVELWDSGGVSRLPEDAVSLRQEVVELMRALQSLPPEQRAALLLVRVEGFSYESVARVLGRSLTAVKSLVHRATVALRNRRLGGRQWVSRA